MTPAEAYELASEHVEDLKYSLLAAWHPDKRAEIAKLLIHWKAERAKAFDAMQGQLDIEVEG